MTDADAADETAALPPEPTVVLAEDDDELRSTLALWLRDGSWAVREAPNGTAALEKVDAAVDALVLDRRMPELSGPAVVDRLGDTAFDGAVIAMSAYKPDSHLDETDVADYIIKPVDREELLTTLRACVQ